jgi:hypothetical protein
MAGNQFLPSGATGGDRSNKATSVPVCTKHLSRQGSQSRLNKRPGYFARTGPPACGRAVLFGSGGLDGFGSGTESGV